MSIHVPCIYEGHIESQYEATFSMFFNPFFLLKKVMKRFVKITFHPVVQQPLYESPCASLRQELLRSDEAVPVSGETSFSFFVRCICLCMFKEFVRKYTLQQDY